MPETPELIFEDKTRKRNDKMHICVDYTTLDNGATLFTGCSYRNVKILKHPDDLRTILSIIGDIKPSLIIETGTAYGGSAMLYSEFIEEIWEGNLETPYVITIDDFSHFMDPLKVDDHFKTYIMPELTSPENRMLRTGKKVLYIDNNSLTSEVLETICQYLPGRRVLVNLDSDHHTANVAAELKAYADFVSIGSYLIVEDMRIIDKYPDHGPGPDIAVKEFLEKDNRFEIDTTKNQEGSLNFNGYLKRVR